MAQGVPGRLRPHIFLTFGTTRVVGHQPHAPAAFTPGEIPGIHFQRLSRSQGTWFLRGEPQKKSPVTPVGIDPETVRLVARCLNHYVTPGPSLSYTGPKILLYTFLSEMFFCFLSLFVNTFTAIVDLSRFNNSCLKSPASTLVDLTFQPRAPLFQLKSAT